MRPLSVCLCVSVRAERKANLHALLPVIKVSLRVRLFVSCV